MALKVSYIWIFFFSETKHLFRSINILKDTAINNFQIFIQVELCFTKYTTRTILSMSMPVHSEALSQLVNRTRIILPSIFWHIGFNARFLYGRRIYQRWIFSYKNFVYQWRFGWNTIVIAVLFSSQYSFKYPFGVSKQRQNAVLDIRIQKLTWKCPKCTSWMKEFFDFSKVCILFMHRQLKYCCHKHNTMFHEITVGRAAFFCSIWYKNEMKSIYFGIRCAMQGVITQSLTNIVIYSLKYWISNTTRGPIQLGFSWLITASKFRERFDSIWVFQSTVHDTQILHT